MDGNNDVQVHDNVSSHAPVDPALVLPDAVRISRDRAHALMEAQNAPPAAPPNGQQQPVGQPPNNHYSDPALTGDSQPTNPGQQSPFDLLMPQQPQAPPPAPPGNGQPEPGPEDWKRRFDSINGRYHNEVPRLRDAVNELAQRNEQLERMVQSRQTPPQGPGTGPGTGNGPDTPPLTADFTPQEIEDWGPDMLGMITRVAENRAAQVARQLQPMVHQTQATARAAMMDQLDRDIPEWRQINVAQEFMDWALLPDDFSGAIRRDLLKRAWEANNASRVAVFFRSFISGMPGRPASQSPQSAPPAPQPQAPASNRLSLQDLAAPSGSGSAADGMPPPPAAKRIYKRSEIAQFYNSRSLGHFQGREKEAQVVENDIFAAQREGRVTNG